MNRFLNKVALITGAASGIGKATALRLASEGAIVYASDLNAEKLEETYKDNTNIHVAVLNVRDSAAANLLVERIASESGRLDVVVNSAGVSDSPRRLKEEASVDITEITDEDFAFVMEINLYGTFYIMRAAVPLMRKNEQAGGAIINVSSVGALVIFPLEAAYPASKAGVLGLTRSIAALLGKDNIRVNAVAPGSTDTALMPTDPKIRQEVINQGVINRLASPEEIAATIVYLASEEASFITGQTVSPNGGYIG